MVDQENVISAIYRAKFASTRPLEFKPTMTLSTEKIAALSEALNLSALRITDSELNIPDAKFDQLMTPIIEALANEMGQVIEGVVSCSIRNIRADDSMICEQDIRIENGRFARLCIVQNAQKGIEIVLVRPETKTQFKLVSSPNDGNRPKIAFKRTGQ